VVGGVPARPNVANQNCYYETNFLGSKYTKKLFGRVIAPKLTGKAYSTPAYLLTGLGDCFRAGRGWLFVMKAILLQ